MAVDISGLDKAEVLAALYNRSRPQGLGFLQARPGDMTRDQAATLLEQSTYFDYLYGRVIKVDLSDDNSFAEHLYDRDLGDGAAARAVESVRAKVATIA